MEYVFNTCLNCHSIVRSLHLFLKKEEKKLSGNYWLVHPHGASAFCDSIERNRERKKERKKEKKMSADYGLQLR